MKQNIAVHNVEVSYYELFHPEVYSKHEQKRITNTIKRSQRLISDNGKKALDFGQASVT
jgi:hypothetical protein